MPKRRQEDRLIPTSQQDISNSIQTKKELIETFQKTADISEKEIAQYDEMLKNTNNMSNGDIARLKEWKQIAVEATTFNKNMVIKKKKELQRLEGGEGLYVHDEQQKDYQPNYMDVDNPYMVFI